MKKVIFDLDGTIYETNSSILGAVEETMKEFGLPPVEVTQVSQNIGKTLDSFLMSLLPEQVDLEAFKEGFRINERAAVRKHGRLFCGVTELLKELKNRDYSLFICSNGSESYINLVLESTGIRDYFSGITSSKYLTSKGQAFRSLTLEGDFAIIVGDTAIDYLGAVEAGLPSIAASYGYGREEDHALAVFRAANPLEVLDKLLLAEIFHEITSELIGRKKCRCIGINGVDTSGKTRFAEQYARYLEAVHVKNQILHMDDFHNPASIRYQGDSEIEAYYYNAFNYRQVIEEVLQPFKAEGSLNKVILCHNLDTDRYDTERHYILESASVLLMEGVLLFREPLLSYLDGKIFLAISFDEVINRAKLRDVPMYGEEFLEKYKNKYIPVQSKYLQEHKPMEVSDIIIDNTDFRQPRLLKL